MSRWSMWLLTAALFVVGVALAVMIAMASLPSGNRPRP